MQITAQLHGSVDSTRVLDMLNIIHFLSRAMGPHTRPDFLLGRMTRVRSVLIAWVTIFERECRLFEVRRVVLWSDKGHDKGEYRDGSEQDATIIQRQKENV